MEISKEFETMCDVHDKYVDQHKHLYTVGSSPHNMILNRYHNIIALDDTLVKLDHDKYINANMISGKYSPQKFIMTQAPEKNTITDFYQMIHDYNATTVVCLTQLIESGIEKATKYWPDNGSIVYGKWIVELYDCNQTGNIVCRKLDIIDMKTDKCIRLKMFHYVSWIDHDAPSIDDFNKLIELVSHNSNVTVPVIVHCSAGIGRSGTFVSAYNYNLLTKLDQKPDIKNMICWLKRRRTGSVQTISQYKFLLDFCAKN